MRGVMLFVAGLVCGLAMQTTLAQSENAGVSINHVGLRVPSIPDAAAFRVDFPRWLKSLSGRDRRLAEQLMIGARTLDTAHRFRMSPARVSQLRRELCDDHRVDQGERAGDRALARQIPG